jgi:AraC family transcriptional regulator
LEEIKNKIGDTHYGACFTISNKDCSFRYIACVEVSDFKDVPRGMVKETVPAGKYAVYAHKGKLSSIGDTYGFATSDIPNQGMKENGIWFEAYPKDWDPQSDRSVMEIWCGVK